jgi:hypothetical protein
MIVFSWLWSRKYTVNCPDGTTRTVYHRVDDVFPLHLKFAKQSASASISALNQLQAQASFAKDEQISAALSGIDRVNRSIQASFRAAYAIYEASPCTELPYFRAAVERIIVDEQNLRSAETVISHACLLASQIQSPSADIARTIDNMMGKAIHLLAPPSTAALTQEMAQVEDLTKKWREDG